MRLPPWLMYPPLLAGLAISRPVENPRTTLREMRDLLGLLGEDTNVPVNTATPTAAEIPTQLTAALAVTTSTAAETHTPTRVKMAAANPTTSSASASVIEVTPSPAWASMTSSSFYPSPGAVSTSLSITSLAPGVLEDASTTPPAELKQWKVIGIAVIAITFLAILAMAISFFDSWWGFVRAAICGKPRKKAFGSETMIPDWEKRSWEFQLANEDGHRYPTLASLESIVKEKDRVHPFRGTEEGKGMASPDVAYR